MAYRTETHTQTYNGQSFTYTQTFLEPAVSFHAYQCTCAAGFAKCWCEYDFITEYVRHCTVFESTNGTTALIVSLRHGVLNATHDTSQIGAAEGSAVAVTELGGNCDRRVCELSVPERCDVH